MLFGHFITGILVKTLLFTSCLGVRLLFKPQRINDVGKVPLSFASYYGDHMVLQQGIRSAQVWGYADLSDIGSSVNVQLTNDVFPTLTFSYKVPVRKGAFSDRAIWSVLLNPIGNHSPFTLNASLGVQVIKIVDVLFGDVWLCSGQSNMQFSVLGMFNATEEMANAEMYSYVRLFTVAENPSAVPLYDVAVVQQRWSLANSSSIGNGVWSYFSSVCWVYGRYLNRALGYPIGLISTTWGGTAIELWSSPEALARCGLSSPDNIDYMKHIPSEQLTGERVSLNPSNLWNAMIHPLLNISIYGAIWYQGEANANLNTDLYNCTFPSMISDWRRNFYMGTQQQTDPVFPFGFVQLGPNEVGGSTIIRGMADIRWHQTGDLGYVPNERMPNIFMGTAVDLSDYKSPFGGIHPRDKLTTGYRLFLAGLAVAYTGKSKSSSAPFSYQGPFPSRFLTPRGAYTTLIEYDNGQNTIEIRSKSGFEVCCSADNTTSCPMDSNVWIDAPIVNYDLFTITLAWKPCTGMYIMGLRYLWRESPCQYLSCAVYDSIAHLPAPPFIFQGLFQMKQNVADFRK